MRRPCLTLTGKAKSVRIVANAAFLWAVRIATMLSSALVSVLTARFLGPAGRGTYALPFIDSSLAVTFAVGLSSAITYFLLNRKAGRGVGRGALIGLLVFGVGGSIATIATAIGNHSRWAIVPALIYMMLYAVNAVTNGYFIGRDRVRTAGAINGAAYLLTLVLIALALVFFRSSPVAAITAALIAWGIVGFAGLLFATHDASRLDGAAVKTVELLRFGGKAGALNLANLLNYRVDIYIVAMLLPVATLGLYTIAVTGAESALSLTLAIAQSTLPRIGAAGRGEAGVFVARCLRNGLLFAAFFSAAAYVMAPPIVRILLGQAYLPLILPFRFLLIGVVAASTTAVITNYFMLNLGRAYVPLTTSLISAAICAAISLALVPRVGMVGAAIGSTVAYAASQTLAIVLFCRQSGVSASNALFVNRDDFSMYRRIIRRAALHLTWAPR